MLVSADIHSNYLFSPAYRELKPFVRTFSARMVQTKLGYTYASYSTVPSATVIDATYYGKVAKKTRSYNNQQQLLHDLQLGLNGTDGKIIDASKGLILNKDLIVANTELGYMCNHIPVLYSLAKGDNYTVITGFTGNYDFLKNLFYGQIQFGDVRELWNV